MKFSKLLPASALTLALIGTSITPAFAEVQSKTVETKSNSAVTNISDIKDVNESIFTENFRNKVDEFVTISDDKTFKIINEEELKKKITNEEFLQLTQQIESANSLIREIKQEDLIINDGKLTYNFSLEQQNINEPTVLASNTPEGINRIEFYYWGYKIWLTKTTVNKILNVGTQGGAAALGAAIGNVPGAVAGAIVGSILGEFINPTIARAVYIQVLYPSILINIQVI